MITVLAILVGLYLITMIGYYKMMFRMKELGGASPPLVLKISVSVLALFWPLIILWSLVTEAIKT